MLGLACTASGQQSNQPEQLSGGFPVDKHSVPVSEILDGGPAKDAIPALTNPEFVSADEADRFLSGEDRVLAIEIEGQAKAYPIKILNWHEAVNDTVSGEPLLVSW